jgi:hypothetical protein
MPQGTRAAEVDALCVSAAVTGVVWARDPDCYEQMRLSFGRGPRPIATTPFGSVSGALLQSPHGDIGLR